MWTQDERGQVRGWNRANGQEDDSQSGDGGRSQQGSLEGTIYMLIGAVDVVWHTLLEIFLIIHNTWYLHHVWAVNQEQQEERSTMF